ncbi:MAG: glucose-6-phosphate dehydrogenase [Aquificota bacterium]|nr:glucose-6-phosphate dehydrogenase [Aquificota bacterium]
MGKGKVIFIYGGTGDLARRKIYPVIQKLMKRGRLRDLKAVYALSRSGFPEGYLETLDRELAEKIRFVNFDVSRREDYRVLEKEIASFPGDELIFYLALPPHLFDQAIVHTGSVLRHFMNPRKIVVEKPFGFDLESARMLNFQLKRYFTEREIYRIDHFLGKVSIQNILSFRFSNYIFEGIWNKNFIDNVQISALETVGLEGRVSYYDRVGALRDMVQNHLFQILCFVAMEPPAVMEAERIRDEKVKVLSSVRRIKPEEVDRYAVRGSYRGYEEELGRPSNTETYACMKLYIDNFRWEGVPFYLRTGKKLKEKKTQVVITFKEIPGNFGKILGCMPERNKIGFEIAPGNRLILSFEMMPPTGFLSCPVESRMEVSLEDAFGGEIPDAYETLIEDILDGDQTLFIREDESELAWEIVQPILERWSEGSPELYEPGSYGPEGAERFIKSDGRRWVLL